MKPTELQDQLLPILNRYKRELEEEMQDIKMQGITQGWEECRQAHKVQLPKVLEDLITSCRGIVNIREAENILREYKKNNNVQLTFNENEIHRVMQESFEAGKRHLKHLVDGQNPYYDNSMDFADQYLGNVRRVGRVVTPHDSNCDQAMPAQYEWAGTGQSAGVEYGTGVIDGTVMASAEIGVTEGDMQQL